jgi:geranylgeranyl pyrophosphate synthase
MWTTKLRAYQVKIEQNLIYYLPKMDSRVLEAARYSLLAGGKRLRPILLLAYFEALSGKKPNREIMRCACSVEYAHTFSLIHDDLPGIDNDILRRGQPTCHTKYDEATAILAGDFLLSWSLENLTRLKMTAVTKKKLLVILGTAIRQVIAGEMLDILGEREPLDQAVLQQMFEQKTASLFSATLQLAAVLASSNLKHAEKLGHLLGLAFQIQDDVLGATGDSAKLGKTIGLDAQAGKSTWVRTYGLTQAQLDYQTYYQQGRALLATTVQPSTAQRFLLDLITYLQNREQ